MKFSVVADAAQIERRLNQAYSAVGDAADAAVRGSTEEAKKMARAAISSVLGPRAGNAFRSRYFLDDRGSNTGRVAIAGLAYSGWFRRGAGGANAVDVFAAHEEGATIRARQAENLASPLSTAGSIGRNEAGQRVRITPKLFEQRTGLKLRPVRVRGKTFLVVDEAGLDRYGRASRVRGGPRKKRGGLKAAAQTRFVFLLRPAVTLPKRLDLASIRTRTGEDLEKRFMAEFARRGGT